MNDLETIVQKFIQAEEQNFSLFNYVNDLNNEIEKLEEQVAEMKQEKELIHGQGASASSQHEQIIAELEVCDRPPAANRLSPFLWWRNFWKASSLFVLTPHSPSLMWRMTRQSCTSNSTMRRSKHWKGFVQASIHSSIALAVNLAQLQRCGSSSPLPFLILY